MLSNKMLGSFLIYSKLSVANKYKIEPELGTTHA